MRRVKRTRTNNSPVVTRGAPVRDRILKAAFAAFTERGFAQASTLDIATRARASKRDLYVHFESKEAMLAECIKARAARMRGRIDVPRVSDRTTLAAALQAFGESMLRHGSDPSVIAIHRLAVADAMHSPEVARILNETGREANRTALAWLLAQGQMIGLVTEGDTRRMAEKFFALLWGDLFLRLMLGVAKRPAAAQVRLRAAHAVRDFFALHTRYKPSECRRTWSSQGCGDCRHGGFVRVRRGRR
jgi:AcrR family transcriptional regulator